MEASASAPTSPEIELEPPEWQPRALWVGSRELCGVSAFYFAAFFFAYFYLRSLDSNKSWTIGSVHPPVAFGVAILVLLVLSAIALRAAAQRPELTLRAGGAALAFAMLAIVLQVIEWTTLGFGPASGGYASVFIGWTVSFAVYGLLCAYWIETQVATAWRRGRERIGATPADVLTDVETVHAGVRACSFFWTFSVVIGAVMFVLLYVLGT
ncbi:MAG TPA: hypothetical protein VHV75_02590 [Solirubrobacteraceae bacterium]|jgi:heme/copper-type cytochrome/quinol oxidase subunit 3|nr:hypothetical protein [Solirubrobacteraceae bacterium]